MLIFIDETMLLEDKEELVSVGEMMRENKHLTNVTEMDGFEGNSGIIIIAPLIDQMSDSVLMRPGRFDRQVTVDAPDIKGRLSILKVHAKNKKLQEDLTLESIAKNTCFTGADLANYLTRPNLTARRRKDSIIFRNR